MVLNRKLKIMNMLIELLVILQITGENGKRAVSLKLIIAVPRTPPVNLIWTPKPCIQLFKSIRSLNNLNFHRALLIHIFQERRDPSSRRRLRIFSAITASSRGMPRRNGFNSKWLITNMKNQKDKK
jgi:hypothetical protein